MQPVAPTGGFQNGGWYNGQQYFNGSFSAPGQFHSASGQTGPAPVQNAADAAYLASRGDTTAPSRVVSQPGTAAPTAGTPSGAGFGMPSAPAPFDLIGATEGAYNTPEIHAAQQAILDRQTALATASSGINDNPFYSEATRVGKQAMLTDRANADIKVQQDNLAMLHANAAIKVNAALGQYNIQRQAYQDTLSQFNNLLQAGGLDNASTKDLANMSVATGIPISELQSIQKVQNSKDTKVSTTTVSDPSGQYVVALDDKGQIISKTKVGEASSTGGAGGQTYNEQQTAVTAAVNAGVTDLERGVPWGDVWNRLHTQFPQLSPAAIDNLLGTSWREPGAYQKYATNKGGNSSYPLPSAG